MNDIGMHIFKIIFFPKFNDGLIKNVFYAKQLLMYLNDYFD